MVNLDRRLSDAALRLRPAAQPIRLARTVLRPLTVADAPALLWIADPEVQRHLPGAPQTECQLERYAGWVEAQASTGVLLGLAVTVDERVVGVMQAWSRDAEARTIEWGVAIKRDCWGAGLLQEAGAAFLQFVFGELGVRRVEARTAVDNGRAITALKRLGATCEGPLRAGLADGRTDCLLWSMTPVLVPGRATTLGGPNEDVVC